MYVYILPKHVCIPHIYLVFMEPKEGIESLEIGDNDACEPQCEWRGLNSVSSGRVISVLILWVIHLSSSSSIHFQLSLIQIFRTLWNKTRFNVTIYHKWAWQWWHTTLIPAFRGRSISVSSKSVWSIECVLGQPKTHRRNHVLKNKIKQTIRIYCKWSNVCAQ